MVSAWPRVAEYHTMTYMSDAYCYFKIWINIYTIFWGAGQLVMLCILLILAKLLSNSLYLSDIGRLMTIYVNLPFPKIIEYTTFLVRRSVINVTQDIKFMYVYKEFIIWFQILLSLSLSFLMIIGNLLYFSICSYMNLVCLASYGCCQPC